MKQLFRHGRAAVRFGFYMVVGHVSLYKSGYFGHVHTCGTHKPSIGPSVQHTHTRLAVKP